MFDEIFIYLSKQSGKASFGIKDKIFFMKELSFLINGGVSIVEALNLIKDNSPNSTIIFICETLHESLKKGETLYRSMSRLPKYFNEGDINIIKSGESSGELVKVLRYLSDEYEFIYDIRNKYIGAMLYPSIVMLICVIAVFFIFRFVLPPIFVVLTQFEGAQIPAGTQVLIWLTNFFVNYTWHIFIILGFAIFAFYIMYNLEDFRRKFDKAMFSMPLIGTITKHYFLIKYLRYKKLLIYSGIGYVDVFKLLKSIIPNREYQVLCNHMIDHMRRGGSMHDTLKQFPHIIPVEVATLLKVGEETASVVQSIDNAIWLYEEEFKKMLNNLSKIIEPILIVFIGAVVGFVALSVFSIITSILDSLQAS